MYRAKELGRNQVQLFTAAMNERYVRRLETEQRLHHALERRELELYYQPIYDRPRRRVHSVEALVRWNHPDRGLVEPKDFIALAEETGLIVPIGESVLHETSRPLRAWHDCGRPAPRAGVYIAAPQVPPHRFITMS